VITLLLLQKPFVQAFWLLPPIKKKKLSTMFFALPLVAALFGLASAQSYNQSKPFNLVLSSQDKTLNNQKLTACHTGAAIESLCLTSGASGESQTFYYNYTTETTPTSGILIWNLNVTTFIESEAMAFNYDPSTNVALPLFSPGDETTQQVVFDSKNSLLVPIYLDDTVTPPASVYPPKNTSRWFVCQVSTFLS
jgi:hypothetical protein